MKNLMEQPRETAKITIITEYFNIPLSIIDKTGIKKMIKI